MAWQVVHKTRREIDDDKWNACIDNSINGLIYAKSYYLDALADSWCALVLNDYDAVFPVTYKKKFGIQYVCMPPFVQQLGIFLKAPISAPANNDMLSAAQQLFRFGEYNFNFQNSLPASAKRNNYILNLKADYSSIYKNFKSNLKYDLKKSLLNRLQYSAENDPEKGIILFENLYADRGLKISQMEYKRFTSLCQMLIKKEEVIIRRVTNTANDLCSIAVCVKDQRRIYFILSATTTEGRSLKANHFLIDRLIHEFCGQELLLDFEGSNIPGIAHFYKSFGAWNQPYYHYGWNRLPWPISYFKNRN